MTPKQIQSLSSRLKKSKNTDNLEQYYRYLSQIAYKLKYKL